MYISGLDLNACYELTRKWFKHDDMANHLVKNTSFLNLQEAGAIADIIKEYISGELFEYANELETDRQRLDAYLEGIKFAVQSIDVNKKTDILEYKKIEILE